jgi:hypothetical protein
MPTKYSNNKNQNTHKHDKSNDKRTTTRATVGARVIIITTTTRARATYRPFSTSCAFCDSHCTEAQDTVVLREEVMIEKLAQKTTKRHEDKQREGSQTERRVTSTRGNEELTKKEAT